MTTELARKPRPRRIAADEAHSWARHLKLGNPYAKLVLSMLTIYVNGDGSCFAGIEQLSEDTELSADTVRKRLAWLERVGAIARLPQWIDASGRRNGDGRGKRTSDEIRLLTNADPELIEARANGDIDPDAEISPSSRQGLNPGPDPVSPLPALCQPSDSGEGLTSEPEPEKIPPNPPTGGSGIEDEAKEARWQQFRASAYPDGIVDLEAARREFWPLGEGDQVDAIAGVPAYADRCRRRREKSMKAHLYLRKRVWVGLLANPETRHVGASPYSPNSPAGKGLLTLGSVARHSLFRLQTGVVFLGEITPQLLAMADAPPESEWITYARGSQNFGAWWELISKIFAGRALTTLTELRAPWPFPPRKDGTINATAPPIGDNMTEDDVDALTK